MRRIQRLRAGVSASLLAALLTLPFGVLAQTRVVAPKNPYSPAKDVELGRQAAQQAERQMPLLEDRATQAYIEQIGQRLARAIPAEFQHPEFRYSYKVVNVRDVNAFALPGGFTYVNRGLIETAQTEGQLAGAIAHEISHVALRHGTAQAAKAQKYQAGSVAAQILGAVIGGGAGQVVGAAGQLGIGAAFLRFSRDYERQADMLGAHIMAEAGYDPHELANMFRILEQMGGKSGPEWLSDHPNPGNRFETINREADALNVSNGERDSQQFHTIQARLRDMGRAPSMSEASRSGGRYPNSQRYPRDTDQTYPDSRRYPDDTERTDRRYPDESERTDRRNPRDTDAAASRNVDYPSSRYRTYDAGAVRISVPDNWREIRSDNNEVTYAPEGGYQTTNNGVAFTHGAQVELTRASSRNLQTETDDLINSLTQGNPELRRSGSPWRTTVSGRQALSVSLHNVSEVTGRPETVTLLTTLTDRGELLYVIFVAPSDEYANYQSAFDRIARSLVVNR
ncbi:MAG TPA: M48 family metallopeptidase [Blastocatellia bacterium]|nr:M48 family metallopeptidase [Blastocatellia bacterium]